MHSLPFTHELVYEYDAGDVSHMSGWYGAGYGYKGSGKFCGTTQALGMSCI